MGILIAVFESMHFLVVSLLLLFSSMTRGECPKNPLTNFDQLIVSVAHDWQSSEVSIAMFKKTENSWRKDDDSKDPFTGVIGRTGLAWGIGLHGDSIKKKDELEKQEGDGKSPAGVFSLGHSFGKSENTSVQPDLEITDNSVCVDDWTKAPGQYNVLFESPTIANSTEISREKMIEYTTGHENEKGPQYNVGLLVQHNYGPTLDPVQTPVLGAGSCIFLHVWRGPKKPTAGCTAMAQSRMEDLVEWARKAPTALLQLPRSRYNELKACWNLPNL